MLKNRMTNHITLAELDAVSHGLPVALFDSGGHNMYCNTEYFRRCGIIDDKAMCLSGKYPTDGQSAFLVNRA